MIILRDAKGIRTTTETLAAIMQRWLLTLDEIDRDREHMIMVALDTRDKIKLIEIVSMGTLNASLVHARELYIRAILSRAASIIIMHNHPSNDCDPSDEDIAVTTKLQAAGNVIGIKLRDHIIFCPNSFVSLKGHGLL